MRWCSIQFNGILPDFCGHSDLTENSNHGNPWTTKDPTLQPGVQFSSGRHAPATWRNQARDGSHPTVGESLVYNLVRGKDGKPQATNITRKAIGQKPPQRVRSPKSKPQNSLVGTVLAGLLLLGMAAVGFDYFQSHYKRNELAQETPQPLITPAANPEPAPGRTCDGRTQCSQMTSCAEAKWFINHCPGTQMDGNHDGTPCEKQWCTSQFFN